MFNSRKFGERLREAREKAGMTMVQVRDNVYVSQGVISRYENGLVYPTIERVYELAKLYGCSMDWLCGLEDDI